MKSDYLSFWWKLLRLIIPVLLYLISFVMLRFLIGRLSGDKNAFEPFIPTLLMLPIAVLCRSEWRYSRIELPLLAALLVLSFFLTGFRSKLPEFLGTVVAGPINEELIYRGCVYEQGKGYWGAKWSACLSSLLFAVGHTSLPQALIAFAMGLAFAFLLEKTRLIEVPIALHGLINAVQFMLSFK